MLIKLENGKNNLNDTFMSDTKTVKISVASKTKGFRKDNEKLMFIENK